MQFKTTNTDSFHYSDNSFIVPGYIKDDALFDISGDEILNLNIATAIALLTKKISDLIGLNSSEIENSKPNNFYEKNVFNLIYKNKIFSESLNEDIFFLRGWKEFSSCIKGYNAIGLIAEQIYYYKLKIIREEISEITIVKKYIKSKNLFSNNDLNNIVANDLIKNQDILLSSLVWLLFANKTIVCSTSTNMGIALHEFIILLRNKLINFQNQSFSIFGENDGSLIVWAPDRRADFMSNEKADYLFKIQNEENSPTKIKTYIDRRERDPGAINDAIELNGYFFPTNPQSKLELMELLKKGISLYLKKHNKTNLMEVFSDKKDFFDSLGLEVSSNRPALIQRGVEGGIYGLMLPIFFLLNSNEFLNQSNSDLSRVWNQASIGAALAGACLAVYIAQNYKHILNEYNINDLISHFPNLPRAETKKIRVSGTFDIANLQSLAQLLGVIVEKHLSGKGVPFVGLGSSSYSNGNLCYDILNSCTQNQLIFNGNKDFFPSTHLINFFSQAIIFASELHHCVEEILQKNKEADFDFIISILQFYKLKPENAGAAAVSGYLLHSLDNKLLNIFSFIRLLQQLGYSSELLTKFLSFSDIKSIENLKEIAVSEGPYMKQLLEDVLQLIDLPSWLIEEIENQNLGENSSPNKISSEFKNSKVTNVFYLTGDNTIQPPLEFLREMILVQFKKFNS